MGFTGQPARSDDETYLSYVSPLLLRRLRSPEPIVAPEMERGSGAVALLDVERFSTFAERMSRRGSEGVELLATRINETFATVVDTIERFGGIAHGFPGDSVIALWTADGCTTEEATLRAARCSLELVAALRDSELPLKAGLAAGDLRFVHVGGIGGRLQMLLSGEPLEHMGRAEERSSRGRLVVSEAAWRLLSPHAIASALSDGFFEVKSIRTAASSVPAPAPGGPWPIGTAEAARAYLPSALLRQLDAGHAAWLGEFREVTTVFIQIRPPASVSGDFAAVHEAFRAVQRSLHRYGGDVARFAHDDKGLAVLAVFGLPPAPSEDAAAHAVAAAIQLESDAVALGFGCRVGMATGRVFCGTLGAQHRREYSVVGSTPNLAARLMQSVEAGVLCDAVTAQAAGDDTHFESGGCLTLKGFPQPVEVFRPHGAGAAVAQPRGAASVVIGRETEMQRLRAWIEDVHRLLAERRAAGDAAGASTIEAGARRGCFAVVQGEAGIGKTTLVRDAVERAARGGFEIVRVACEVVESSSSYATWVRVVADVLRLDETTSRHERTARVRRALAAAGVEEDVAPLASPVLDVDIEETAASREIAGAARADNLLALLSRLVTHLAAEVRSRSAGLLLVLEDVHWLDAASWELLGVVTRSLDAGHIGVLATMRSETAPTSAGWQSIVTSPETERIALRALARGETTELAQRLLGAPEVAPRLVDLLYERARGNPFFSAQLLAAMSESGLVGIEGGVADMRIRSADQAESLVPRSVAAVVTSRLDRLPAPVLLTLKAASVIGERFRIDVLRAIHPMQLDERTLLDHLAGARELGLVEDAGDDAVLQRFEHAITCDVAYGMLLVSQRRELHRGAAEYLGRDGGGPQAVLFYHWRRSGDEARALEHVDRAGVEAMRSGDYHSVIELYGYALQTIAGRPEREAASRTRPAREALWSAHLGEAQVAIGLHEAARPNLEMSLELLGESARRGPVALVGAIAREALRQVAHRAVPARFEGARAAESARLGLAASSFEQLGFVYYSSGDTVPGLYASLRILNLSELASIPHLMARSYAVMSLSAGVVGLRRLAALYDRRAIDLARRHGDPHTSAYVGWVTGLRATGEAAWELAAMRTEPALRLAEQLGDRRLAIMCLSTLGTSPYARGDFAAAIAIGERQLAIARESNNRLWEAWAMNGIAEPALMLGDTETAVRCCTRALAVLAEENDRAEEVRALGVLAAALLRQGQTDEAGATARRALDRAEGAQSTSYISYEGLAGISEVMLALCESARVRDGAVPSSLRRDVRRAIAAQAHFAKTFRLARPRLHAARARAAMLADTPSHARRELELALRSAEELGMSHARGIALVEAARCDAFDASERKRHAEEAVSVLHESAALGEARSLLEELRA